MSEEKSGRFVIVELQCDEADRIVEMIDRGEIDDAVNYMSQWDYGGESEHCMSFHPDEISGRSTPEIKHNGYFVTIDTQIPSVTLSRPGVF